MVTLADWPRCAPNACGWGRYVRKRRAESRVDHDRRVGLGSWIEPDGTRRGHRTAARLSVTERGTTCTSGDVQNLEPFAASAGFTTLSELRSARPRARPRRRAPTWSPEHRQWHPSTSWSRPRMRFCRDGLALSLPRSKSTQYRAGSPPCTTQSSRSPRFPDSRPTSSSTWVTSGCYPV